MYWFVWMCLTRMKYKGNEFSLLNIEGPYKVYMMWHMPPGCAVLEHFGIYVAKS